MEKAQKVYEKIMETEKIRKDVEEYISEKKQELHKLEQALHQKSSKTFGTCLGGLKSPAVALEGKEARIGPFPQRRRL